MIDVAAIDPVSSVLPSAVTHKPTASALASAARVRVYVVAGDVSTVRVTGTAGVAALSCGRELSIVKLALLTAVTLPEAPSPPNPVPPLPGPRVRTARGAREGRVAAPFASGGRAPGARSPPRAGQAPFTAGEISTEAAEIVPPVVLVVGGLAPSRPEAVRAVRAWTQIPTTTPERRAARVWLKVVVREYVKVVWVSVLWICSVVPSTWASIPVTPGKPRDPLPGAPSEAAVAGEVGTATGAEVPLHALTKSTAQHAAAPAAIWFTVISLTHFSRRRWGRVVRRGWRDRRRPRCR